MLTVNEDIHLRGSEYDLWTDDDNTADVGRQISPVLPNYVRYILQILCVFFMIFFAIIGIHAIFFFLHVMYVWPFEWRKINKSVEVNFSCENYTFDFMNETEFEFAYANWFSTKQISNFYEQFQLQLSHLLCSLEKIVDMIRLIRNAY